MRSILQLEFPSHEEIRRLVLFVWFFHSAYIVLFVVFALIWKKLRENPSLFVGAIVLLIVALTLNIERHADLLDSGGRGGGGIGAVLAVPIWGHLINLLAAGVYVLYFFTLRFIKRIASMFR